MKKSHKVIAAAAAGALLVTAGATAAANAGTAGATGTQAPAAIPAVDVQPAPETVVQQNRIAVGASAQAVSAALAKCQADKLPFVTLRRVSTTSGKKLRISPDSEFAAQVKVVEQN